MYVTGQSFGFFKGQKLLIDTAGPTTADPHRRQLVQLNANGVEITDPLFNIQITQILWRPEDALTEQHDLTRTTVAGNLVPATQGVSKIDVFGIFPALHTNPMPRAMAPFGPNSTANDPNWQYLYTISSDPLAYLPAPNGSPQPEILLTRTSGSPQPWTWVPSLLEAGESEEKFTIDAGTWRSLGTGNDYDGSAGSTLRFGDGVFGLRPIDSDIFETRHLESRGAIGNVPNDAVNSIDPMWGGALTKATNPFPRAAAPTPKPTSRSGGGRPGFSEPPLPRRPPRRLQRPPASSVGCSAPAPSIAGREAGHHLRYRGPEERRRHLARPATSSCPPTAEIASPRWIRMSTRPARAMCQFRSEASWLCQPRRTPIQATCIPGSIWLATRCAMPTARSAFSPSSTISRWHPVRAQPSGGRRFRECDSRRLRRLLDRVPPPRFQSGGFMELPTVIVKFAPGEIFRLDNDDDHAERGSYSPRR